MGGLATEVEVARTIRSARAEMRCSQAAPVDLQQPWGKCKSECYAASDTPFPCELGRLCLDGRARLGDGMCEPSGVRPCGGVADKDGGG